jgi:toxin CcdB
MSRFDVYPTPGKDAAGYVLDVQADLLSELGTRVVVPLILHDTAPKAARGLNPAFEINGSLHLMLTQFIAAVPKKQLGKPLLSLKARSDDISRALDFLLVGF